MTDDWLHIGRIVAVNVARRQVRVAVIPGRECNLDGCDCLRLVAVGADPIQVRVSNARATNSEVIVELTPGISRDVVATLKNAVVLAPSVSGSRQAKACAGLHDLPEMRVVTTDGSLVGIVTETHDTPGGGIMRLQCDNGVMATAPVTDAFIVKIDLNAGIITVAEPEAFLVVDSDADRRKASRKAAQD